MRPEQKARLNQRLEEAEACLRAGDTAGAARRLKRLLSRPLPRELLPGCASLARRLQQPKRALRLLLPYVHPLDREAALLARPAETIQYASTLIYLGATGEGLKMLEGLDAASFPDVYFHRALGLIAEWRYREAIEPLSRYVSLPGVSDYQRAAAGVNLLASLVFEDEKAVAERKLESLLKETAGLSALHGSVLQLGAILAIESGQFPEARRRLEQAERQVSPSSRVQLFVRKWRAILNGKEGASSAVTVKALQAIAKQALEVRHWETVRDCDKYIALVTGDADRLARVYMGTPFTSYREHLLKEWKQAGGGELPSHYLWAGSSAAPHILDLAAATLDERPLLKRQGLEHRLLRALGRDLYRPHRIAELHAQMYLGMPYHPDASPARVKTALARLRQRLSAAGYPDLIRAQRNAFAFQIENKLGILLSETRESGHNDPWASLSDVFSAADASRALALPRRSAFRLLQLAVEKGELQLEGAGRATRYRKR